MGFNDYMHTNTTTNTRPTEPRIRKAYVNLLDQFIVLGWDTEKIVGSFNGDYITADKVDRRRAFLNWDDENPIVDGPNYRDLPLHRQPCGLVITVDDAEDRDRSARNETAARREGRTCWVGYRNGGWVAPVD